MPWQEVIELKSCAIFNDEDIDGMWSQFVHITAWTVPLKLIYYEEKRNDPAKDSVITTNNNTQLEHGFYTKLPVEGLSSRAVRVYMLDASYYKSERREAIENGSFTGVLVNKPAECSWKYAFLLVAEEKGDHFERIGSICPDRTIQRGIYTANGEFDDRYYEKTENMPEQH